MCTIWWSLIFIKSCPCPELIYRKFFRNQSYGEISTPAGSWGTGAFFEEQIATTGRLCAKLSHHPSTRNFKKTFFSFSVFFLSNFPLHHHLGGESGLSLAGCPYFRSNHIAWVHESMHFLYIFGPQLWTLGAREIPMTFTGLCCDLDLWRSAEDVIGWFWFILALYMFGRYSKFKRVILAGSWNIHNLQLVVLNSWSPQKWDQVRSKCWYPQIWL